MQTHTLQTRLLVPLLLAALALSGCGGIQVGLEPTPSVTPAPSETLLLTEIPTAAPPKTPTIDIVLLSPVQISNLAQDCSDIFSEYLNHTYITDVKVDPQGENLFYTTREGIFSLKIETGETTQVFPQYYLGKLFGPIDANRLLIIDPLDSEVCVWNIFSLSRFYCFQSLSMNTHMATSHTVRAIPQP